MEGGHMEVHVLHSMHKWLVFMYCIVLMNQLLFITNIYGDQIHAKSSIEEGQ